MRPRLILPLALILALGGASLAHAGTYDVRVCDAAGGTNHAWFKAVSNSTLYYAGTQCPSAGDGRRGLVARAAETSGGFASYGSYAEMRLTAPTRASIVAYAIRGSASIRGLTGHWRAGIQDASGFHGCDASSSCSHIFGPRSGTPSWTNTGPSSWLRLVTQCVDGGGCNTTAGTPAATVNGYYVAARIQDNTAPSLGAIGPAWGDGQWHRGTIGLIYGGSDNSGICRVTLSREDGSTLTSNAYPRDDASTTPCATGPTGGMSIDTGASATALTDGAHMLSLIATDAAGNTTTKRATVLVDNTAPNRPENVQVDGGSGWRRTNAFHITWQNPGGQAAPIVAAQVRLCHEPDGVCAAAERFTGTGVTSADLAVPGRGTWAARVWLEDAAGNSYESISSDPVTLRFDDVAPDLVAFEPTDPAHPRELRVQVHDADSGIAGGSVEISRAGTGVWRTVRTRLEGSELISLVDDTHLRDGDYLIRAYATDAAGNSTLSTNRLDGSVVQLTLPLRARLALHAGLIPRHGSRARPARRRTVAYGTKLIVRGRLTNRDGQPVAGVRINAFRRLRRPGAGSSPLGTTRTDQSGRFAYLLRARASERVRLVYGGSGLLAPASETLRVKVRASSTLRISPGFVLNGQSITLRGRMRGGMVPPGGKLFALQAYFRGGWRSFAGPYHTRRDGRWRARYRFTSTTGRQTYRFRVFIPTEAGYPFAPGYSAVRAVTVRGL